MFQTPSAGHAISFTLLPALAHSNTNPIHYMRRDLFLRDSVTLRGHKQVIATGQVSSAVTWLTSLILGRLPRWHHLLWPKYFVNVTTVCWSVTWQGHDHFLSNPFHFTWHTGRYCSRSHCHEIPCVMRPGSPRELVQTEHNKTLLLKIQNNLIPWRLSM